MSGKELPLEVIQSASQRSMSTYNPNKEAVMEIAQFTHEAYPDQVPYVPTEEELFYLEPLKEVLREKGLPDDPLGGNITL